MGTRELPFTARISAADPFTKVHLCHIDHGFPQPTKMSGLMFENQNALDLFVADMQKIKNGFVPTCNFPYNGGLIAMKDYVGDDELVEFLEGKRWEIEKKVALHPKPDWSNGVRPVVKSMFQTHATGKSMGFSYKHTYVNESAGTVAFTGLREGALANPDQHIEIWNDLQEVKKLMQTIEENDFQLPDTRPTDLLVFYALFPATAPTNLDDAIVLSYIICHAPLFMGPSERYKFASTYHVLREEDKSNFDKIVNYLGIWGDLGKWWEKIKQGNDPKLISLFQRSESGTSKGLMPFIRRCYHHMSSREQNISDFDRYDLQLIGLFPDAFSKAYIALFKVRDEPSFHITKTFVGKFREGQPKPLDYSKTD